MEIIIQVANPFYRANQLASPFHDAHVHSGGPDYSVKNCS